MKSIGPHQERPGKQQFRWTPVLHKIFIAFYMLNRVNILRQCIYLIFWAIIFFLPSPSCAQELNRWKTYTVEDGLWNNPNFHLVQDGNGFFWSTYGLQRFDGYTFKTYNEDLNDSLGLHLDLMEQNVKMIIDDAGDLWIECLDNGTISRYDFQRDGFVTYKHAIEMESLAGNRSGLWIGTRGKGLIYFDPETGVIRKYLNDVRDSLMSINSNYFSSIIDKGAYLMCSTHSGLWKFDKATKSFTRPLLHASDSILLCGNSVYVDQVIPKGDHYWLKILGRSKDGLLVTKVDSSFSVIQKIKVPYPVGNLLGPFVVDSHDVFWMSTKNEGLLRYDPFSRQSTFYTNEPENPNSLPNNFVAELLVDRDQNVWASTSKGISRLMAKTADFYNYKSTTDVTDTRLGSIEFVKGRNANYLIRTALSGIWTAAFDRNALGSLHFQRIVIQSDLANFGYITSGVKSRNGFWVVAGNSLFKLSINLQTGLPEGKVISHLSAKSNDPHSNSGLLLNLQKDEQQNLWMGTMNGDDVALDKVILTAEGDVDSVIHFRHDSLDSNSLIVGKVIAEAGVHTTCQEGSNSRWIATAAGLDLFRDGHFEHLLSGYCIGVKKVSDGTVLASVFGHGFFEGHREGDQYRFNKVLAFEGQTVLSMEEDRYGRLWIPTNRGLFLYNRLNQNIRQLTTEYVSGSKFMNYSLQTPDSIMVFGTETGVVLVDPLTYRASKSKPHPYITELRVNNMPARVRGHSIYPGEFVIDQSISSLPELTIDYIHNFFSLDFAAMELTSPEKNLYRYKLEDLNKDWVETDSRNRTATYMNLDPGYYKFKVKATNSEGVWSDQEATLTIHVLPAPWKTWWAYSIYGVLAVVVFYISRRSVINRERLKSNLKLEQLEREKEHMELEKAQEVDKMKSAFFANISHEFRTPLTLIKGPVANLLEEFVDNPKVKGQLKLVQRNSDLLLKLINQLLDLARLETGSLRVEKSEVDVNAFLNLLVSSFSSFALQKNIQLKAYLPQERCEALFDKDKVETILINLINNAIKFTPADGKVNVHAVLEKIDHNKDASHLFLAVSDTGIGIPEELQSKIFERFYQVSEVHKEVGTGIGLALVKELAELMEGTISVKSIPGEGSTFEVTLPVTPIKTLSEQVAQAEPVKGGKKEIKIIADRDATLAEDTSKPHVLVVEDNDDLRSFIIDSLGNEFYFLEAGDGKKGLEKATNDVPDLIISDVMMPEMDGITMAGKIKKDIRTSHIPLILLTAKTTEDSKLSGLESGADDYLTKPFNKNELLLKVRNSIALRSKMREKIRAELMTTAPRVEVLSADEKFLSDVKEGILNRLSDEQLSVESLAEDIGMSRVQLYRKISALTGLSVNELIRNLRLQKAAQLLEQNWGTVSQVAFEVGFSNPSYFSKVFKEEYGVQPSEYQAEKS